MDDVNDSPPPLKGEGGAVAAQGFALIRYDQFQLFLH
jgi:hypothetical protein